MEAAEGIVLGIGTPRLIRASTVECPLRFRRSGHPTPTLRERVLAAPRDHERLWVGLGLLLAALLFFFFRAHAVVSDGALYTLTVERSQFFVRSLHVGYYAVGWLGSQLMRPLGIPTDDALILLNGVLTAAAAGMAWVFYRALGVSRTVSIASFFALLFAGNVLNEGINVEIHALELLTLLSSYVLFLRDRPLAAGLMFGAATLVTPLATLGSGFFLWDAWRRRRWRPMLVALAAAIVTFGAVIAFCWQEYFFGTRGLFEAGPARSWTVDNVLYNVFAIAKSFHWAVPFALAGIVALGRMHDPLIALMVLTLDFHLPAFLGTRDNGVLAISCYPIVALAIGTGVGAVLATLRRPSDGKMLIAAAAALYVVTSIFVWVDAPGRNYRQAFVGLLRAAPPGSVVVTSWSNMMALEYYAHHHRLPLPTLVNSRVMNDAELRRALAGHAHAFAVEGLYPNRLSLWLPQAWIDHHYRGQAVIPKIHALAPTSIEPISGPEPLVARLQPRLASR